MPPAAKQLTRLLPLDSSRRGDSNGTKTIPNGAVFVFLQNIYDFVNLSQRNRRNHRLPATSGKSLGSLAAYLPFPPFAWQPPRDLEPTAAPGQALRRSAIASGGCSAYGRLTIVEIRRLRQTPGKAREPTPEPPLLVAPLSPPSGASGYSGKVYRRLPKPTEASSLGRRLSRRFLSLPTSPPLFP